MSLLKLVEIWTYYLITVKIIFRFNLHRNWHVTIFILNLAFAELLYCVINLPIYVYLDSYKKWDLGHHFCEISTTIRYINLFANYMSVAMIAVSRCIMVTKPKFCANLVSRRNRIISIISIWLYGLILVLPTNFGVSILYSISIILVDAFSVFHEIFCYYSI